MKEVFAAIITIGDELLIGQTIDTNSAFIAQELNKIGIWVRRRLAIGDGRGEILDALQAESRHAQVVIITGGLGPTADDITKPTLCEYFGAKLVEDAGVLQNVTSIFERLGRPMIDRNRRQAEVPDNCVVLPNKRGTAPGMWFEKDGVLYISLPGVPHEMVGLMQDSVLPRLQQQLPLPVILHRSLLTAGKGESEVAEMLLQFEAALPPNIKLAYLPSYGMVKLRLTAKGADAANLEQTLEAHFLQLQQLVREYLVVTEDITLQDAVLQMLKAKGKTLATAESCTGGYLAHILTAIPGSSEVYQGSIISYANKVKEDLLDVPAATLSTVGAVSEATVVKMAQGVREKMDTDFSVATSGIMGPGGGSAEKPVGTVWVAVASRSGVRARKFQFRFDRKRNIELTAVNALNMLRQLVQEQS